MFCVMPKDIEFSRTLNMQDAACASFDTGNDNSGRACLPPLLANIMDLNLETTQLTIDYSQVSSPFAANKLFPLILIEPKLF